MGSVTGPAPHDRASSRRALRKLRAEALGDAAEQPRPAARTTLATRPIVIPVVPPQPRTGPVTVGPAAGPDATVAADPPDLLAVARAEEDAAPRHARRRRATRTRVSVAAAVLVIGGAVAVTAALAGTRAVEASDSPGPSSDVEVAGGDVTTETAPPPGLIPPPVASVPGSTIAGAPAAVDLCVNPAVTAAISSGDDAATIAAAGGAEQLRQAVAGGRAPCVRLDDSSRVWVVVDKARPHAPLDYAPAPLAAPSAVRSLEGEELRGDAAEALSALGAAAVAEGAGEIAMESGYRSYASQQQNFGSGGADVEASVARPGYSEHQSGLAADIVACADGCGSMDDLAATPQGAWVAANAWRFGWIVRYEDGRSGVTGYIPEPWHLRYIGTDLSQSYHDGGWHTLEEFFGLPAAPAY